MPTETDPLTDTDRRLRLARALGWTEMQEERGIFGGVLTGVQPEGDRERLPDWPNDPAAALDLVDDLAGRGFRVNLYCHAGGWEVSVLGGGLAEGVYSHGPSLAACMAEAALRALETEPK